MSSLFDVRKQLAFYGAYHSHPVNIWIHIFGVPAILWSAFVLSTRLPRPAFLPPIQYVFNDYMIFETNAPFVTAIIYMVYYFILDPVAAFLYAPQMTLSLLTATAYAYRPDGIRNAVIVQVVSWVSQFIGHGFAEGRAPALLDNIVGAVVLAPFFVHLEILFHVGYRPELQRQLKNDVGVEIARIRREKAEKRRAEKKTS
ncbi:hypothetical protein ID866_4044 [Astraeus odoratus]|nr:hypothetical protein ID866_4044 [Astraeus odoratus]